MKKYSLIRKTLKFLGWDSETAKAKDVKVLNIEENATVNYHNTVDATDFSGNINIVSDEETGIDVDEATDQLSATTGHIIITDGASVSMTSGSTLILSLKNEDGAILDNTNFTFTSSNNSRVAIGIASGEILFVSVGSATITVKENSDPDVFSKIKVYVTD